MSKLVFFSLIGIFLVACESIKTQRPELAPYDQTGSNRTSGAKERAPQVPQALKPNEAPVNAVQNGTTNIPAAVTPMPEQSNSLASPAAPVSPPVIEQGDRPKIGLLLGPGGLRGYAHIGVLQELLKAKLPIVSVVGFETGALVGGIFSAKGQTYDVEWQMMKLHEEDFLKKSLMTNAKPQDVRVLSGFLQNALGSTKAEDAKINFACPSYNLVKRQVFIMSRGPMTAMLPYCLPFVPFFKPYEQNIAALTSLTVAIKFLKSKGVNYIIYVDLLGEKTVPFFAETDSSENMEWATVAEALESQLMEVNRVIAVPLNGLYINDFSKRREMSQKGQEAGRAASREIINDLRL